MDPPNHLIIVCGHAIWAGGPTKGRDESEWIIESYKKGETPTFIKHVKAGLKALAEDHHAVLMFSGGPTVPSTPLSEARSYANLAAANAYWGLLPDTSTTTTTSITTTTSPHHHHPRIELEERALDSYQNILFSIIQFWRRTGYSDWPTHLTIVSHAFKRRRLVSAHCAALGFVDGDRHTQPRRGVTFVGINPPGVPEVVENEEKAVEAWVHDPQGQSSGLRGKRRGRNPWKVSQTLFLDEAERERSGLHTRLVENEDVREDILVDGVARPWEQ